MQTQRCKIKFTYFHEKPHNIMNSGFAFPIVIFFATILFILISAIWFITRQEVDDTMKYICKIKAEGLSEAIHTYLLTQCYSQSWDKRFYKTKIDFDMKKKSGDKNVDGMLNSINKIITGDKLINGKISFSGSIGSIMPKDGMRIIIIKVRVFYDTLTPQKEFICLHEYYDLYKRDLLDSLGEKIGFFYDYEKETLNENVVPSVVVDSFQKSATSNEGISETEKNYKKEVANNQPSDVNMPPIPSRQVFWGSNDNNH